MRLVITLPTETFLDTPVVKVIAEATNGFFCLEPKHLDVASALVPGLLTFVDNDEQSGFIAIDDAVLVKCGAEVLVSTHRAVRSDDLGLLKETVATQFLQLDDRERVARSAIARLEASVFKNFMKLH